MVLVRDKTQLNDLCNLTLYSSTQGSSQIISFNHSFARTLLGNKPIILHRSEVLSKDMLIDPSRTT